MKRFLLYSIYAISVMSAFSCQKATPEDPGKPSEVSTLAEIAASATSNPTSFSAKVQDVVVTCVSNKYAHLEDKSGAILVWVSKHGLSVGQKINGNISGKIQLYDGYSTYKGPGYALMTDIDYSSATVTSGATLPLREVTLKELNDSIENYFNERIIVKGVTVTTGISSGVQTGVISQDGSTMNIFNKNKEAVINTGLTGNLTAYPIVNKGVKELLVYTSDQFEEKTVPAEDNGFTRLSTPGVYEITDIENPVPIYAIGSDGQSAYSKSDSHINCRIQNLNDGVLYGAFINSATMITGSSYSSRILTVDGNNSGTTDATLTVSKTSSTMVWLKDTSANKGYIFNIL